MALTRRSLLSMLSAGIASVAVSTRLAASELRVVGNSWFNVTGDFWVNTAYEKGDVRRYGAIPDSARSAPARG